MDKKIQKELKVFQEFKNRYEFNQKEILQIGDDLYCDGELLQTGEEKETMDNLFFDY